MAASLKVIGNDMAVSNDKAASERQKALDAALAQIDRAFGKGSRHAARLKGDDAG